MATLNSRSQCITCAKEKAIAKCAGCSQGFCFNHLTEHRHQLNQQVDDIEITRDLFRETLIQQKIEPQKHPLIQQIDQWEKDSVYQIRQTAEEARLLLVTHLNEHTAQLEQKLTLLTNEFQQSREENDIIETDLQKWQEELTQLAGKFSKPSHITIQQSSIPLINKIRVNISVPRPIRAANPNVKWIQNGITVAGGNGQGNGLNQLSDPWSVYVNDAQTIYVVDRSNHRIMECMNGMTHGQVVAGGNGQGNQSNQLNCPVNVIVDEQNDSLIISDYGNRRIVKWPRRNSTSGETIISNVNCWGLAIDKDGYLYVSDVNKHEVRRYEQGNTNGTVVAGGNGRGKRLDQLNGPYYIYVDEDRSVYVPDCNNHRVMKWKDGAKTGIVVAGDQDYGKGMTELSGPFGVIVDQVGTVYVADGNNHRVMRWLKGATQGSVVVGGNGSGKKTNQFSSPCALSLDSQNNLYVVDNHNHRVQKFPIDQNSTM